MKITIFISIMVSLIIIPAYASALTVRDVVKDLACPCDCPLVLEDCNMSCGLKWKKEVGEQIAKGKTKQEIIDYFVAKYGESARLTPIQKVYGKIYQFTRGFGKGNWGILAAAGLMWGVILFFITYGGINKFMRKKKDK